jgi:hypothetical protein
MHQPGWRGTTRNVQYDVIALSDHKQISWGSPMLSTLLSHASNSCCISSYGILALAYFGTHFELTDTTMET